MALINYLTRVHFADRVLEDALAEQMKLLCIRRPLIITDQADTGDEPMSRVIDALPDAGNALVHRIASTRAGAHKALAETLSSYADGRCDGYIGVGSETAISLARCTAHAAQGPAGDQPLDLSGAPARAARSRLIVIPTTTACIGLQPIPSFAAHDALGRGQDPSAMLPDAILCDPTLTLTQPPFVTAATGMDALSHCIEAFLGTTWNPPADGIALDGVRRAVASLDRAVRDGTDLDARREMMAAALDAGLSSQKGLGAVEALSQALDEESGGSLLHGCFHAALFPVVLAFNAPAISARLLILRDLLHLDSNEDVQEAITALGVRIHLPANLASLHLNSAAHQRVARRAAEHPATRTNPRFVTAADYVAMLEQAS